jgi:hypothetical protein
MPSSIHELKKSLIDYYDRIKSEIDIEVQLQLLEIEDQTERDELLKINLVLVNECDRLCDANMTEINAATLTMTTLDEREVIRHHCAFIPYKNLSKFFHKNIIFWPANLRQPSIGLLIVTDWFMEKNQLDFLHLLFYGKLDEIKSNGLFEINEHVLLLIMVMKDGMENASPEHIIILKREELTGRLSSVTEF